MKAITLFVLSACIHCGGEQVNQAHSINRGQKSTLLEVGMTEQQVFKSIGYGPNKSELKTCGSDSARGS